MEAMDQFIDDDGHDGHYYYKMFLKAIVRESVFNTVKEAIDEFSILKGVEQGHKTRCICTHVIQENCFVESKVNKKILVIGNQCIRNFFPKEIAKEADDIIKAEKRKTVDCTGCGKRVNKAEDRSLCKKCFEKQVSCGACKGQFFPQAMAMFYGRRICKQCKDLLPTCAGTNCATKVHTLGDVCRVVHLKCASCQEVIERNGDRSVCTVCYDALPTCACGTCTTKVQISGDLCKEHSRCTHCARVFKGDAGYCDTCRPLFCSCGGRKQPKYPQCRDCHGTPCEHTGCRNYAGKPFRFCFHHKSHNLTNTCAVCDRPILEQYSVCFTHYQS